ncbi:unnamed protein product [Sympodiomycopsis kandeliae]
MRFPFSHAICICTCAVSVIAHPIALELRGPPTRVIFNRGQGNAPAEDSRTLSPNHSSSQIPSHQQQVPSPPHIPTTSTQAWGGASSSGKRKPKHTPAYKVGKARIRKQKSGINAPAWSAHSASPDHNLRWMKGLRLEPASEPFDFLSDSPTSSSGSESAFLSSSSSSSSEASSPTSTVSSPKLKSRPGTPPACPPSRGKGKEAMATSPARTSSSSSKSNDASKVAGPSGSKHP